MHQSIIFLLIAGVSRATEIGGSREDRCAVDFLIGKYVYMRVQPNYTQAFALRFDKEDNLFIISYNALDIFEEYAEIKLSVIYRGEPGVPKILLLEPDANPEAIAVDNNGRVLVATDNGLYTHDNTTNQIVFHALKNIHLSDVTVGPGNEVIIVKKHDKTVNLLRGETLETYRNLTSGYNLFVDHMYSVYGDDGWYSWYHGNKTFEEIDIDGTMAFTDMTTDEEGNIYAVNESGLWLRPFDSLDFSKVKRIGNPASSVAVDSFGNLAIGEEDFILRLNKIGLAEPLKKECGENFTIISCFLCDIAYI